MQFIISLYPFIAILLSVAMPAFATDVLRTSGNSSHAYYSSFSGCEDVVVGVTVNENKTKAVQGELSTVSKVSVFGTINDICEFGTTFNFYGTAVLEPGEYSQDDTDKATLIKSMNIDGTAVELSLTWTGQGEISTEHDQIKNDEAGIRTITNQHTSDRNASVEGVFAMNNKNRVSGNTLSGGSLGTNRSVTVSDE